MSQPGADEPGADQPGAGEPEDPFERHRSLLFTVAYELLASAHEAEDVVQDTWLRWSAADRSDVRDPRAYLVRTVTRQALNRMRTLQRRRETYVGPWLPEPLLTAPDVAEDVALADSVSLAMLVVLDSLSPLERAVFVLREVFALEYAEVAEATGRTPEAVRQLASRARRHVAARRPPPQEDRTDRRRDQDAQRVTAGFFAAAATGDLQQLMDLLAPDVMLLTDGGGKVKAALRPILGPEKVARFLIGIRSTEGEVSYAWRLVNGKPAALVLIDGRLDTVATARVVDGRVVEVLAVRNPDKLTGLDEERHLTR